jgi:hypothetical protein
MRHEATLTVPRTVASDMDSLCSKAPVENLGKLHLFDGQVEFSNGMMMAIQVIPCDEEPAWTQGVLFVPGDGGFFEAGCTDVQDKLTGEYVVFLDEDAYVVNVVAGDVDLCEVKS